MKRILLLLICLISYQLVSEAQIFNSKSKAENTNSDFNEKFSELKWRNIGPYRAGRTVACTGVIGDPQTYYMGSVGGGVWKTTDAGLTWKNISDGQLATASVGAIEIAPSDKNVIYVGMGEHPVRGVMCSRGDGMYKSTDAGETWNYIGLPESHHIAEIAIHPHDPDIVYVAVQGQLYGPSKERGVYKSVDGGKTWANIHFINDNTGCSDISLDASNPRILYAGMWDHQRTPWNIRSGGPGSGIWKSTDAGTSWTKLENGLPAGMGKVAVDVSPANPQVVYANIEADNGGVFRSDNGGKDWRQTSNARVTKARAWYYIEIFADPKDENKVWVLNSPMLKSIDGGKTFQSVNIPHVDQHDMWINPDNTDNIVNSNDGGCVITFNGCKTWSPIDNQPTAQFYRVIADEQYPYMIYAGQQDNSTVAISSQTTGGGIGVRDWHPVAGGESAFIAFTNPQNPKKIFGTSIQGFIDVWDDEVRIKKDIQPYPEPKLGTNPEDMKFRFNWNPPIVSSKKNPGVLYFGGNVLFRSDDEGQNWTEISKDLTRNDTTRHGPGSYPYTNEAAGGEVYNTLAYIATSPHDGNEIWVGSDCGLVHMTTDEGKSWTNVTPKELIKSESLINSIEISPTDKGKAYIVATKYKWNDDTPLIYKTENYGKSWKKITKGLASDNFVRVVREDPENANILYAGTERGLFVSIDNGKNWQSFQSNLPMTPITDLIIRDNDLIASTAGRSFWILDDLGPLQQSLNNDLAKETMIFQPTPTRQYTLSSYSPAHTGQNPGVGVMINYNLPSDWVDSLDLTLEITDQDGNLIRSMSNKKDPDYKSWFGGPSPDMVIPNNPGLNRMYWDMRRESLPGVEGVHAFGSFQGSRVAPGTYKLKLISAKETIFTTCEILPHPSIKVSEDVYAEQQSLLKLAEDGVKDIHNKVNRLRKVKKQLAAMLEKLEEAENVDDLKKKGEEINKAIVEWENKLIQPKTKTFQDVINYQSKLNSELLIVKGVMDNIDPRVTGGAKQRLQEALDEWKGLDQELQRIIGEELGEFNKMYKDKNLPALIMPSEDKADRA